MFSCKTTEKSAIKNIEGNETVRIMPLKAEAIVFPSIPENDVYKTVFDLTKLIKASKFLDDNILTEESIDKLRLSDFERKRYSDSMKDESVKFKDDIKFMTILSSCLRGGINQALAKFLRQDSKLWRSLTKGFKKVDTVESTHVVVIDRIDLGIRREPDLWDYRKTVTFYLGGENLRLSLINMNDLDAYYLNIPPQTKSYKTRKVEGVLAVGDANRTPGDYKNFKGFSDPAMVISPSGCEFKLMDEESNEKSSLDLFFSMAVDNMIANFKK